MGIYLHDSNTSFWISVHDCVNNRSSSPPSRQKTAMNIQDTSGIVQLVKQALKTKILNIGYTSYFSDFICLREQD